MLGSQDFLLTNILLSFLAALVYAVIPLLFGYGFDKASVGISRARFLFVLVLLFGSLLGFALGTYIGMFLAILFSLEIATQKEKTNIPNN